MHKLLTNALGLAAELLLIASNAANSAAFKMHKLSIKLWNVRARLRAMIDSPESIEQG